MIIAQTGTFWTSILAYCVFVEPIFPVEIIAMVICFAGTVTITMSSVNETSDETTTGNYTTEQQIVGYSLIFLVSWI